MGMYSWEIVGIVQTVLTGLVLFPALWLFTLILHKPGAKHDHTRRWVDLTKVAFGCWCLSELLTVIGYIIIIVVRFRRSWGGRSKEFDAVSYLYTTSGLIYTVGQVVFFLAVFYLSHALTQLRTGAEAEESREYRIGRKAALGTGALVGVVGLAAFCCNIAGEALYQSARDSDRYNPRDWDNAFRLQAAGTYMGMANTFILFIVAGGLTAYAVMAFKKARGSPVHKAATLLLVCVVLWDVSKLWSTIYDILYLAHVFFWGPYWYFGLIHVFLAIWTSFGALVVLYLLASKESYGLARVHYRVNDDDEQSA